MSFKYLDMRSNFSASFRRKPESRHVCGRAKGFTLVELMVFIVVGAIILPASFVAFSAAMQYFSSPEYYVKARYYAEELMETVMRNPFDSIECPPSDSPEGFTRSCSINYVIYDVSTQEIVNSASPTLYKKIAIVVSIPASSESYSVSTMITRRPKL